MEEQETVKFSAMCPNCAGSMASGNKFCKLKCYNEYNGIVSDP